MARYIVGIDLGTTNSAVAYVDTAQPGREICLFPILQLVAAGEVEKRETLPSFLYQPQDGEFGENALRLPWESQVEHKDHLPSIVGFLAKEQGAKQPDRLISSAKSWLSHSGVDRTAPLLPWHGALDVPKLSPSGVNARYLEHIKHAWNHEFPQHPLQEQEIILTVPASYDEVARELTVEAAAQAGLNHVVLLEEPQAAFYHWLSTHTLDWQSFMQAGQTILVCDIGGGTTDFTLITVETGQEGHLELQRVRVGEHLILGGDNLDLTLAHHVEEQLSALDVRQWGMLVRKCQSAKETLLAPDATAELTISLPQAGRKLFQNARQITLTQETVRQVLLEGFLPLVDRSQRPETHKIGFQEFGLNYASEPAISRHLAEFLAATDAGPGNENNDMFPDIILLNGGFFKTPVFVERMLALISSWGDTPPQVLDNPNMDTAVAYGAAYYGLVKQGQGIRIASGVPRSYYIGFEREEHAEHQAICLIPAGLIEGTQVDLNQAQFKLRLRQPVEFPLFVSNSRPQDVPGEVVTVQTDGIQPLSPIRTMLRAGKKTKQQEVTVTLHAVLTEVGTLKVWCSEAQGNRTWKLEFDTRANLETRTSRSAPPTEKHVHALSGHEETVTNVLQKTFGEIDPDRFPPDRLFADIERIIGMNRRKWPLAFLRSTWECVMELEACRHFNATYEARWLNMIGFCLRPGYGLQTDDWRVQQTWTLLMNSNIIHKRNQLCRAEWWILWRRIAGGLLKTHQENLLQRCLPLLTDDRGSLQEKSKVGNHERAEICRLLGALELLDTSAKIKTGKMLVQALEKKGISRHDDPYLWTLGRIGGRIPMYGPLNTVIPADTVENWLRRLLTIPNWDRKHSFPCMQLARKTGDRYRDIAEDLRREIVSLLHTIDAPPHYLTLITEGGHLDEEEQRLLFGESLPVGLRIL